MNSFLRVAREFLESDQGATAVEYTIMLVLIVLACFATIKTLGSAADGQFWASQAY